MATLTETAYYTRRAINWAILFFFAYILMRIFWSILLSVWLYIFPPKAAPPNHGFGKLPTLAFPQPSATPSGQLAFRLETIEGAVPRASESAAVYFMPKKPPNFLGLPSTQDFAKRLGFDPNPLAETKTIYRFNDPELSLRKMRYDIVSDNFIIRYGFEQDAGLFSQRNIPPPEVAKAEGRNLLQTYDLYPASLANGRIQTSFLQLRGDTLVLTPSISLADAVRVDFFRENIGDMRLLTPDPDEGPVSIVFSGSTMEKKRLLQLAFTFWPIDLQTFATYSLKTSQQAWGELQSGGGYIARYPSKGTTAVIRTVTLAYYDAIDPQTYLQPIFSFEGDDGFVAYVPAVNPEWVEE